MKLKNLTFLVWLGFLFKSLIKATKLIQIKEYYTSKVKTALWGEHYRNCCSRLKMLLENTLSHSKKHIQPGTCLEDELIRSSFSVGQTFQDNSLNYCYSCDYFPNPSLSFLCCSLSNTHNMHINRTQQIFSTSMP